VAEQYTIADIALYAYTHVADEGGFDLGRYPTVRAWLERGREQPRHVLITQG
jgi:glutathione S-transferase